MARQVRVYTAAHRRPLRIGRVGNWVLPFQVSLAQAAAGLVVFAVARIVLRGPLWFVPFRTPILVVVSVAAAVAWDRLRVDGRSVGRAGRGWVAYLSDRLRTRRADRERAV